MLDKAILKDMCVTKLWQQFAFRLGIGWLLVAVLPALLMWHEHLPGWDFLPTQVNSFIAASAAVFMVLLILAKIARFPGQYSFVYIFPVLLLTVLCLGGLFFMLRWVYSVYYLSIVLVLLTVFCFVSVSLHKHSTIQCLAIIPLGRCRDFTPIVVSDAVEWLPLAQPTLPQGKAVDAIVADLSSLELTSDWQAFLAEQTLAGVPVYNNLQVFESLTGRSPIQHLYENNLGSLLPSASYLYFKQFIETMMVLLALPIVLPVMLVTYVAIRLDSAGSAVFVQERVGQGASVFRMYKFRSMTVDAEKDGAKLAQAGDARVTRVGRFIRKTRIDELPQLINVLKGEMSLIGPRPEQPEFAHQFERQIPFYSYRHIVKPGITGWAQVTQGYASNTDETMEKIQRDFYYIKHFSVTLDMLIVVKTVQIMLTGFGAR